MLRPEMELATKFLTRYSNHTPATLLRYAGMPRGFMEWYGESLNINNPKVFIISPYLKRL